MTTRTASEITLVVASHRRPDALSVLLASLGRQTLPPSRFEVAVVVDGVDEHEGDYRRALEEAARRARFDLRHEFQANAGQSVARHRAIVAAASPWICIVDDDMDLVPGFLAAHLEALRAGTSKTVVLGKVIPEEGWRRAPLYEGVRTKAMLELHEAMASGERRPTGHALVTQNVAFAREFYLSVGGFDERLRLGEDTDLGLRFELAGGELVFAEKAAAVHRSRVGSYDAWLRRCVEYGQNNVYIHEKLGRDARAHPLRNLVNGSRLNAIAVHALSWSDAAAFGGIASLRHVGEALQSMGLVEPAIATHKAILAVAYHVGVRRALGSWQSVLRAKRAFAAAPGAPRDPT
jgi:GT2 family glycosyltransferase